MCFRTLFSIFYFKRKIKPIRCSCNLLAVLVASPKLPVFTSAEGGGRSSMAEFIYFFN